MSRLNPAARAGKWSAKHWLLAVGCWVLFVAIAVVVGNKIGTVKQTDPGFTGDTAKAEKILKDADFATPAQESIIVQSRVSIFDDPKFKTVVSEVVTKLAQQKDSQKIISPLTPQGQVLVSKDRHSALIQFEIKGERNDAPDKIEPILQTVDSLHKKHPSFFIAEFGEASATKQLNDTVEKDFQRAEGRTLVVTLIILLAAFGSLVAAGVPVLLAFSGVLAATGILAIISHVYPVADPTKSVILLIGMAVGVDYSLFYIRREREERAKGQSKHESLIKTAATSGQAILISGITVFIAMAGMLFSGSNIFISIAFGAMTMVAVALVGSLSILPAVIHKLGDWVNKIRIPFFGRNLHVNKESGFWNWVLNKVLARPWLSASLSTVLLIALALPIFKLHTQLPSFTDLPKSIPIIKTYERMQAAFPGQQVPAVVVVRAGDVNSTTVQKAVSELKQKALSSGEMFEPILTRISPNHTVETVTIPIAGDGSNGTSKKALEDLRQNIIPSTLTTHSGVEAYVTGQTAGTTDFNDTMKNNMPFVILFVLMLVFVLLLVAFRSIIIPLKAVLLNLLSVGAAYGILVLVFQHKWAEGIFGFTSNGAIASWLPLFLFVILFGLSMDYHIFILSRIKELVDSGTSTDEAVAVGIKRTASVVTSAAIVMVAVFAIFATLSTLDIKQMGIGLAVAILIDATLIRAVLLPSAMKLLGEWNWYLPKWLEWLPHTALAEMSKSNRPTIKK